MLCKLSFWQLCLQHLWYSVLRKLLLLISSARRKLSTEINLGTLSGKTKERVYEPEEGGRKVSQLDWKYSNAAILKGAVNWELNPWLSVDAAGWTTLNSRGEYG